MNRSVITVVAIVIATPTTFASEPMPVPIWADGRAPGDTVQLAEERDTTKPSDSLVAGKAVQRIGNVSVPTISVYSAANEGGARPAVVVCPGGAHRILAYDLEGTEVARWLNSIGVTAVVLKYRVPARDEKRRWLAAVQDAQRTMGMVRGKAADWQIDPKRIGILGFSAGGETAALTALLTQRQYDRQDATDDVSCRPDFAVLVYPGGLVEKDNSRLREHVRVTREAPPMFLVHAFDDPVRIENSLHLCLELKRAGVPAELHVYAAGGHGYGLRRTEKPVTHWPDACEKWLRSSSLIGEIRR